MSHMKSIFGLLLLTALLGLAPLAKPQPYWRSILPDPRPCGRVRRSAPGASPVPLPHLPRPNSRHCGRPLVQNANNTNLVDNRISNTDAGAIWLVWTSGATKVWAYTKVDSVVGDRCFFAKPACSAQVTTWTGADQAIGTNLWGADSTPPAAVQAFFNGAGTAVNVAATDIRPEDAAFVVCRVNSPLGNGSFGTDGTDGLGYNNSPVSRRAFVQVSSAHPRAWPQPLTTREPPSRARTPAALRRPTLCRSTSAAATPSPAPPSRPFRLWKWEPLPSYSSISVRPHSPL